jgi:hypothetical protein
MTLKQYSKIEYKFRTLVPSFSCGRVDGTFHQTYVPDDRLDFAKEIICRWGLVAGETDGEYTAGRSKLRRMTAPEIVGFACDVAELAYAEFDKRGWMERIPSVEEMQRMGIANMPKMDDDGDED